MSELLKCDSCGKEIIPYSTSGYFIVNWESGISSAPTKHFHDRECLILWLEKEKK